MSAVMSAVMSAAVKLAPRSPSAQRGLHAHRALLPKAAPSSLGDRPTQGHRAVTLRRRGDADGDDPLTTLAEDTALHALMARASAIPRLSHDQVCALARRAQDENASAQARRAARNTLVESNLLLVVAVARWFVRPRQPSDYMEDLVSAGMFGLLRAAEKYDPDSGHQFSTYATRWIRQAISRSANTQRVNGMRLPVWVTEVVAAVARVTRESEANATPLPTRLKLPNGYHGALRWWSIEEAQTFVAGLPTNALSLDYTYQLHTGDTTTLGDDLADPTGEEELARVESGDVVARVLAVARECLTPREYAVLAARLATGQASDQTRRAARYNTQAAISRVTGVTRQRVCQIEGRALEKLRAALSARGMTLATLTGREVG